MRGRLIRLGLAAVGLYFVWPALVKVFGSFDDLADIKPRFFVAMAVLEILSFASVWALVGIATSSRRWTLIATAQLVGNAVSSIVPGGGKPDGMPFTPKKYEFKKGAGDGASVMITLGPTLTFGDPTGSVNITAFDKTHIAGTIDLSGTLKGKGASGGVKLTGQFDFKCPGFSGCEQ